MTTESFHLAGVMSGRKRWVSASRQFIYLLIGQEMSDGHRAIADSVESCTLWTAAEAAIGNNKLGKRKKLFRYFKCPPMLVGSESEFQRTHRKFQARTTSSEKKQICVIITNIKLRVLRDAVATMLECDKNQISVEPARFCRFIRFEARRSLQNRFSRSQIDKADLFEALGEWVRPMDA